MALSATLISSSCVIPSLMSIHSPPPSQDTLARTVTYPLHLTNFHCVTMTLSSIVRLSVQSRTMVPLRTEHALTNTGGELQRKPNVEPSLPTSLPPVLSITVELARLLHHMMMPLLSYLGVSLNHPCGLFKIPKVASQLHFISDQEKRCRTQSVTRAHSRAWSSFPQCFGSPVNTYFRPQDSQSRSPCKHQGICCHTQQGPISSP